MGFTNWVHTIHEIFLNENLLSSNLQKFSPTKGPRYTVTSPNSVSPRFLAVAPAAQQQQMMMMMKTFIAYVSVLQFLAHGATWTLWHNMYESSAAQQSCDLHQLSECCHSCHGCSLLLLLKQHIKKSYGLSDTLVNTSSYIS